jgi:molybdopterin biosynthesis enzyme MoaB
MTTRAGNQGCCLIVTTGGTGPSPREGTKADSSLCTAALHACTQADKQGCCLIVTTGGTGPFPGEGAKLTSVLCVAAMHACRLTTKAAA